MNKSALLLLLVVGLLVLTDTVHCRRFDQQQNADTSMMSRDEIKDSARWDHAVQRVDEMLDELMH
uniref:Uncharacterized protein n=1 Tax=Ciona intestinalis TaxID=7719 RepID=H2XK83_CIOIN